MSISRTVYLQRSRAPSPRAWADAIRVAGFPMTMDTDFAIESHSGFLPCTYAGAPAGFEYFFSTVAEMELEPGNVTAAIGDRDVGISLVTHASMRELATAVIAAAVLCTIADGVVQDEESGEITDAEAALADARAILSELGDDLG